MNALAGVLGVVLFVATAGLVHRIVGAHPRTADGGQGPACWVFAVIATLAIKVGLDGQWWPVFAWWPLALAGPWAAWRAGRLRRVPWLPPLTGMTIAGVVAGLPFHEQVGRIAMGALAAAALMVLLGWAAPMLSGRRPVPGEAWLCALVGLAIGTGGVPAIAAAATFGALVELVAAEWRGAGRRQNTASLPAVAALMGGWVGALLSG